jgi:hypothetical protein
MDPPPTYQQLLQQLKHANDQNEEYKFKIAELKQTLEKQQHEISLFKKAYAHVRRNEIRLHTALNQIQSKL